MDEALTRPVQETLKPDAQTHGMYQRDSEVVTPEIPGCLCLYKVGSKRFSLVRNAFWKERVAIAEARHCCQPGALRGAQKSHHVLLGE
jgi:hypothetical protein